MNPELDRAAELLTSGELYWTRDGHYWQLLPNGRTEATGGEFYRTPSGRVFEREASLKTNPKQRNEA